MPRPRDAASARVVRPGTVSSGASDGASTWLAGAALPTEAAAMSADYRPFCLLREAA